MLSPLLSMSTVSKHFQLPQAWLICGDGDPTGSGDIARDLEVCREVYMD